MKSKHRLLAVFIWSLVAFVAILPFVIAAFNPLQNSRNIAYVIGGLSGVAALSLLLVQPLLVAGLVPYLSEVTGRRLHRWIGISLCLLVLAHLWGLYLTSPQDMTDALLLVAPTPFSIYGVIAFWTVLVTLVMVLLRQKIIRSIGPKNWNVLHNLLALVIVVASIVHTVMIEGAMGPVSKWIVVGGILLVTTVVTLYLRIILPVKRSPRA